MILVTNSRPLKVLQTSRLLSSLLGKADHANHPHLSSATSQIFCVNQKKVGDTKWQEQSRKSELVPVNRISLTTQQPHFRRTLNSRDKNQVVCLINCFFRLKLGTDCIKENDLFEMFFGGLWLWGHWLCLRDAKKSVEDNDDNDNNADEELRRRRWWQILPEEGGRSSLRENLGCHSFSEDSYQCRHVSVYWPLINRSTSYLMESSKSALKLDLLHPVKRMGICVEQNWAECEI